MNDKNYDELSYNDKFKVFSKTNILERTKDSVFVVYSEPIPNNNGKIKVKDARKLSYEDIELIGKAYGFYINENNYIYCFGAAIFFPNIFNPHLQCTPFANKRSHS